jgi:mannose-6-phosphate isomerase-like protein (cupin superfamily)
VIQKDFSNCSNESVSHNPDITKQVLLRKGECANILQLARSVFPPGQRVESHSHPDMIEVFMVRSGTGLIIIDKKRFDLKRDVCAIVERGEFHELINTGQDTLTIDYFALKVEGPV